MTRCANPAVIDCNDQTPVAEATETNCMGSERLYLAPRLREYSDKGSEASYWLIKLFFFLEI
jgi:hypothetical protein